MSLSHQTSLNKAALIIIGLSSPACVFATSINGAFNGYYGGAMGGVLQTASNISASAISIFENRYDSQNQISYSQHDVNEHKYSGIGDIYLGYGHFIYDSKVYLAGEIFGNWANRENTLNSWVFHNEPNDDQDFESISGTTTMKLRNSEFGLDIRPGYLMDTNTMVYGRLGVAFNEVTNNTSNLFSFTSTRKIVTNFDKIYLSKLNQSNSKNVTGIRLGIGIEHKVNDALAITADYIYTYYGKVSTSGVANTLTYGEDGAPAILNTDGLRADSSGRMSTQAGMLGIKYYFMPVC